MKANSNRRISDRENHGQPPATWTAEWDKAILNAVLKALDRQFDPAASMLTCHVGGGFSYHDFLRNVDAHPTRDSLSYARLLLESGGHDHCQRAEKIIARVVALQETDPESKFYGIWGHYLEEPAPKMYRVDRNWADFNGALLVLIAARQGRLLPPPLRQRVQEAIRHACVAIRRRNVNMTYTNIAVQGTFVTLAAADILEDAELRRYAQERLRRLAAAIDETGSFAEYNSPTYANVTIENLTRMRMLLRDAEDLALVEKIHHRIWLHLGQRWHPPTSQLAGPMSRCYSTDIGRPLWIQKALRGRLAFVTLDDIRAYRVQVDGEVATLPYQCPESVAELFIRFTGPHEHRELFIAGDRPPVHGVTWLENAFTLGSANRQEFWSQRRPLLAYWGGPMRPARYLAARFLKDDYDFVSALYYGVQSRNCVLGLLNFRSPGGDKHGPIGPIPNAEFNAARLRLRFDLAGVNDNAACLVDGKPVATLPADFPATVRIALDLGSVRLGIAIRAAVFGDRDCRLRLDRGEEEGLLTLSVDLLHVSEPVLVRWRDITEAYAVFTLLMDAGHGTLQSFDTCLAATRFQAKTTGPSREFTWESPAGRLALIGGTHVASIEEQDRVFSDSLDGKPVPQVRLSQERLVELDKKMEMA